MSMIKTIRFATEAEARAFSNQIDDAAGYPRDGVNVGGGRHMPADQSRTLHASYVAIDEAADASEKYVYVVTGEVEAQGDKLAVDSSLALAGAKSDYTPAPKPRP